MQLNYKIQGSGQPVILLHGLFGNLDNLGVIARALTDEYQVIQIDLRNHGLSPWSKEMNYQVMAQDILQLINELSLTNIILIGHSMGGKVAMKLTQYIENDIAQIIVLDIAPITYQADSHNQVFSAIHACAEQKEKERKTIHAIMCTYLPEPTIQFLLKSYKSEHWLFNFDAIEQNYNNIRGWGEISPYLKPILFIKGGESDYINNEYLTDILGQFPYATIEVVEGANHNVHLDKPQQVMTLIKNWIN